MQKLIQKIKKLFNDFSKEHGPEMLADVTLKMTAQYLEIAYDGAGYDLLSCEREYPAKGDLRYRLDALIEAEGYFYEPANSWSLHVYKD